MALNEAKAGFLHNVEKACIFLLSNELLFLVCGNFYFIQLWFIKKSIVSDHIQKDKKKKWLAGYA